MLVDLAKIAFDLAISLLHHSQLLVRKRQTLCLVLFYFPVDLLILRGIELGAVGVSRAPLPLCRLKVGLGELVVPLGEVYYSNCPSILAMR